MPQAICPACGGEAFSTSAGLGCPHCGKLDAGGLSPESFLETLSGDEQDRFWTGALNGRVGMPDIIAAFKRFGINPYRQGSQENEEFSRQRLRASGWDLPARLDGDESVPF